MTDKMKIWDHGYRIRGTLRIALWLLAFAVGFSGSD